MLADAILIVFISFCTALLSEGKMYDVYFKLFRFQGLLSLTVKESLPFSAGVSYVLLYRTESYQRLKQVVERESKKREFSLCFRRGRPVYILSDLYACGGSGTKEGDGGGGVGTPTKPA